MTTESGAARATVTGQLASRWETALNKLREWDPVWAEQCVKMTTNPWLEGVLETKFIELVCIGLNSNHANLNPDGTRRHVRAALAAGASREEILFVLKVASVMAIQSFMFSSPILLKEASLGSLEGEGKTRAKRLREAGGAIPAVERMKAIGKWNEEWDALLFFSPVWTEQYMASVIDLYTMSGFPPKQVELLCLAFDASYTNMYGFGTRYHIKNAMKAGATLEEIVEVLKLCVIQGVQACNLSVLVLAEELERVGLSEKVEA
jgi:alkylhydroperoxidase/carboxymuconolactone decarboxylase family protein YurZ